MNVSVAWVNNIRNVFTESRLQFTYSVAYSLHFVINKRLLAARSKGKREQNAHTLAFNFAFDEEEFSKHCDFHTYTHTKWRDFSPRYWYSSVKPWTIFETFLPIFPLHRSLFQPAEPNCIMSAYFSPTTNHKTFVVGSLIQIIELKTMTLFKKIP